MITVHKTEIRDTTGLMTIEEYMDLNCKTPGARGRQMVRFGVLMGVLAKTRSKLSDSLDGLEILVGVIPCLESSGMDIYLVCQQSDGSSLIVSPYRMRWLDGLDL